MLQTSCRSGRLIVRRFVEARYDLEHPHVTLRDRQIVLACAQVVFMTEDIQHGCRDAPAFDPSQPLLVQFSVNPQDDSIVDRSVRKSQLTGAVAGEPEVKGPPDQIPIGPS